MSRAKLLHAFSQLAQTLNLPVRATRSEILIAAFHELQTLSSSAAPGTKVHLKRTKGKLLKVTAIRVDHVSKHDHFGVMPFASSQSHAASSPATLMSAAIPIAGGGQHMACALSWEGHYQQVHSGERAASFVPHESMHAPPHFADDSQRRVAANTLPSEMRPVQHVQHGVEEQHGTPLCDLQVKGVGRTRTRRFRKGLERTHPVSYRLSTVCRVSSQTLIAATVAVERASASQHCGRCGKTETPRWRKMGTLCNACGLQVARAARRAA